MLPPPALDRFAAQYGLMNRIQARSDLTDFERRRLYRHPDTAWRSRRVLQHRAAPPSLGSQLLAPVLDAMPSAALWGAPAALWWGFGRNRSPLITVARPLGAVRDTLGKLHRIANFDPIDFTEHEGIPIARPERIILGMAGDATRAVGPSRLRSRRLWSDDEILRPAVARMEPIIDHAWRLGIIDGAFIHEMAERHEGKGNAGNIVLRILLAKRPPDYLPPGSQLERRFEQIVGRDAERLVRQEPVADERGFIGRVDYRAKSKPVIIEINGETFHCSLTDRAADERRYQRLIALGYAVVIVWEYDVWHQGSAVRDAVARALASGSPAPGLWRPTTAPWELLRIDRSRTPA